MLIKETTMPANKPISIEIMTVVRKQTIQTVASHLLNRQYFFKLAICISIAFNATTMILDKIAYNTNENNQK